MTITTKFYPPFIACVNKLKEKYGEGFEKLNGFHNSNLNFTDFIDKFTETSTVADSTIDPNANSSAHDVVTLMSDMMKPHTKLIGYNKVFFELAKNMAFMLQVSGWRMNGLAFTCMILPRFLSNLIVIAMIWKTLQEKDCTS